MVLFVWADYLPSRPKVVSVIKGRAGNQARLVVCAYTFYLNSFILLANALHMNTAPQSADIKVDFELIGSAGPRFRT